MGKTRTEYAAKNFVWSSVGNFAKSILGFVSRTVFIYTLGTTYLGINGLFSNVLGMLSLAELGVGVAIGFSLYKPLASKDTAKVLAYMHFYRNAYRLIALFVGVVGMSLIPFLKYIVNGAEEVQYLVPIYCIYLFNTVTSYLFSYRAIVLSADQKGYLVANVNTVFSGLMTVAQIFALIITHNYIAYLVMQTVVQLAGKIYSDYYTVKKYPYLKDKTVVYLSKDEKKIIFTKIRALMIHRIGDVAVNQTDNIVISSFLNVTIVGLVSNFVLIINLINSFVNTFFGAAISGLGNLMATESNGHKTKTFQNYDFLGFWFYGWTAICLYFLLSPFITIWIGSDKLIDDVTIALLCINYYFAGQRVPLGNVKVAAGLYEQDTWIPFAQAITNIVVSVIGIRLFGLKGVYIGTLVSSMIPNLARPLIVYKYVFETSPVPYYMEFIKRIFIMAVSMLAIQVISQGIALNDPWTRLFVLAGLCCIIPNLVFYLFYKKTGEFFYAKNMIKSLSNKIPKK